MGSAAAVLHEHDLRRAIPEGLSKPPDIPAAIFDAALNSVLALRRLDMQGLAAEVGLGRATLYREVGSRDRLLGEVLWYLTRHAMARALAATAALRGEERVESVIGQFMHDVHGQEPFLRMLAAEPEASLRILTSKHGPVQRGIIDALARVMEEEEEAGRLRELADRETLAYLIVRIGESFLYADIIADNEPDVDLAVKLIRRLIVGGN